jgi:hypothetical protein
MDEARRVSERARANQSKLKLEHVPDCLRLTSLLSLPWDFMSLSGRSIGLTQYDLRGVVDVGNSFKVPVAVISDVS